MNNTTKAILILLILFINISYSQTYKIEVQKLNVRENPDQNSKIIGTYSINDTVNIISQDGNWLKIKAGEKEGFILKKFTKEISLIEDTEINKGFVFGFKKVFSKSFIIIGIVFFLYQSYKRRIVDSRYKTGYRDGKISIREYLTYGVYSLIISSFIGFISGIAFWISTF